jgi:hypothetical protein
VETVGGPPAPGMALAAVVMTGGPPTSRDSARDIAVKWGGSGGSALFLRWGKVVKEAIGSAIYRARVLVGCRIILGFVSNRNEDPLKIWSGFACIQISRS